jgi:ABC-2 type transport system ATP-binding protein
LNTILTIQGLQKSYGRVQALNNLSLRVEKGSVYGLLGPNGSGKTTTLGILLGTITPDGGSFRWFDEISMKTARKRIGAILETPAFYPYLNARQNLKIVADIKEIPFHYIEESLKAVDLDKEGHRKYSTYSLGMKQRLALASAILSKPEVLVLDEPTNGLDPHGINLVRELIQRISATGVTILLASHLLDEVQKVCSHVAVLKTGKLVYDGPVSQLMTETESVEVKSENLDNLKLALQEYKNATSIQQEGDGFKVSLSSQTSSKELSEYLFHKGIMVTHFSVVKSSLEKQYLDLLKKS